VYSGFTGRPRAVLRGRTAVVHDKPREMLRLPVHGARGRPHRPCRLFRCRRPLLYESASGPPVYAWQTECQTTSQLLSAQQSAGQRTRSGQSTSPSLYSRQWQIQETAGVRGRFQGGPEGIAALKIYTSAN